MPSSVTDRPCLANLRQDEDTRSPVFPSLLEMSEQTNLEILNITMDPNKSMMNESTEHLGLHSSKQPIITETSPASAQFTENILLASITVPPTSSINLPSTSSINTPSTSSSQVSFKSPFEFRDPIKAKPRQTNRKRRN